MKHIITSALILVMVACQAPPPPILATVPPFTLTAANGEPFSSNTLVGEPYVVSFFFTSCRTICPQVMGAVRGTLDKAKGRNVSLRAISLTVDPVTDTPAKLTQYIAEAKLTDPRWTLLTGSEKDLETVIVKGFMAYVGEREDLPGGLFDIGHEGRMMLVDKLGRLRGLYELDAEAQTRLVDDAGRI